MGFRLILLFLSTLLVCLYCLRAMLLLNLSKGSTSLLRAVCQSMHVTVFVIDLVAMCIVLVVRSIV